jgi:(p)ppGpp synthase/HD superfamily hydrolase
MDHPLERAIRLAARIHKGQLDRFGQPYILHVLRVVTHGRDVDEQVLGALHDVLERSELTVEDLREKGFAPQVLRAVVHITRDPKETYEAYIERVARDPLAARVKIHDLRDKMDLRDVAALSPADRRRFDKQKAALERLKQLEPSV